MQAQAPDPIGEEFQVNSYTTSWQVYPAVAVEPQGDFVVVWMSDGSCRHRLGGLQHPGAALRRRRRTRGGRVPGQHLHDELPNGHPRWLSSPKATSWWCGRATRSYGDGHELLQHPGPALRLRRRTRGGRVPGQHLHDGRPSGDLRWLSIPKATSWWCGRATARTARTRVRFSIQGQRYDSDGAPVGDQFQVNTYTTGGQVGPAVAVDPHGDFVVVWTSYGSQRHGHERLEHPGPALRLGRHTRGGPVPGQHLHDELPKETRGGGGRPRRLRGGLAKQRLVRHGYERLAASRASATTRAAHPWGASSRSMPTRQAPN